MPDHPRKLTVGEVAEASEKAMGEMRDCDSVETDNGMKYWGFDDEIAACEAALKRCNE